MAIEILFWFMSLLIIAEIVSILVTWTVLRKVNKILEERLTRRKKQKHNPVDPMTQETLDKFIKPKKRKKAKQ